MDKLLALQFVLADRDVNGYDRIIEIEERILANADDMYKVDGHDWGSGEMNIFIFTADPCKTLEKVKTMIPPDLPYAAGYRAIDEAHYTILYPPGLNQFDVM